MADNNAGLREAVVTIKIVGIGGGGNNVLRRLAESGMDKSQLLAINTDVRQLRVLDSEGIPAVLIGAQLAKGRGTGGDVEKGQSAAVGDAERIAAALQGTDLVFLTAGMGKGVGTGAAPVVAKIARDLQILTVGMVTLPFSHEGSMRMAVAEAGVKRLRDYMDALVVVRNDNIERLPDFKRISVGEGFGFVDDVLRQSIGSIVEMIQTTGIINVDFADVTTIFRSGSTSEAVMGMGEGKSALEAVQNAISSPLIEESIKGARGLIVNLTGNSTLPLFDVKDANDFLYDNTHPDVDNIIGLVRDDSLDDNTVRATVIATNFDPQVIADQRNSIKPIQFGAGTQDKKPAVQPLYVSKNEAKQTGQTPAPKQDVREDGPELIGFMKRPSSSGAAPSFNFATTKND